MGRRGSPGRRRRLGRSGRRSLGEGGGIVAGGSRGRGQGGSRGRAGRVVGRGSCLAGEVGAGVGVVGVVVGRGRIGSEKCGSVSKFLRVAASGWVEVG